MERQTLFERKIKPILHYVGTIGSVLMCIAYIAIVFIMIFGFHTQTTILQTIAFAIVNAVVGLSIMQLLKIQGIDFAKTIPENEKILKEYNLIKKKNKKTHSLKYFWTTTFIKDVIVKAFTIIITTVGMIYIVIRGSNDYSLLLLAIVNLIMFCCFGLLSLNKAYDFFNCEYIPFIQEKINERKEEQEAEAAAKAETKKRLEMAKKELNKQTNDMVYTNRRDNFLEPSVDNCAVCSNIQPLVVDSNNRSNNVLGGAVHTSSPSSSGVNTIIEENTSKNIKTEE